MSTTVFTYGSLTVPAVMEIVTGQIYRNEDAELHGYTRFTVSGQVYPGIVPAKSGCVNGRVYEGIDQAALASARLFRE